jgi:hypothetical protein
VVGIFGKGQFFGEGCLTDQSLRTATMSALGDCQISSIAKAAMIASRASTASRIKNFWILMGTAPWSIEIKRPLPLNGRYWRTADIGLSARLSGNSGLMHRNKIRPIRHLVAAAEHRMRYHRIDRDRGFESRRQACRRLVERKFLAGEAEPGRAVSARLTVIAWRTVTCCHTTNAGSCRRNG